VALPPSCFTEAWGNRPAVPYEVGLRRASAGEAELANKEACAKVDELFPELKNYHHDPVWKQAYDIALLHYLLSYTLTRPEDVDQPLWPRMDANDWVGRANTSEGLSIARNPTGQMVSLRFTTDGVGRLYDEMHILALENNPLYPELDDEEIASLFSRLPTELAELEAPAAPGEREARVDGRHATATEVRRMLGYLSNLLETGMTRPPQPVTKKESPPRG
jgi:hypothetical protein